MITAIIRNKENTLVLDFPRSIYDLYEKLQSVGIIRPVLKALLPSCRILWRCPNSAALRRRST